MSSYRFLTSLPGDPRTCLAVRDQVEQLRSTFSRYRDDFLMLDLNVRNWKGSAQESFSSSYSVQKNDWEASIDDLDMAITAMDTYLDELRHARNVLSFYEEAAHDLCDEEQTLLSSSDPSQHYVRLSEISTALVELEDERDAVLRRLKAEGHEQSLILLASMHNEPETARTPSARHKLTSQELSLLISELDALNTDQVDQWTIGDCYFIAPLAGLFNSRKGRVFIRNQIRVHRDQSGEADGFIVTLYEADKKPVETFVDHVYSFGAGERKENTTRPTIASIFESALGQSNPNGLEGGIFRDGVNGGFTSDAYAMLTGESSTDYRPNVIGYGNYIYAPDTKQKIIAALANDQVATVHSRHLFQGNSYTAYPVDHNGNRAKKIQILSSHAYTVLEANEHYVKVRNPHGETPDPEGVFYLSWGEYARVFANTTLGDPLP